MSQPPADPDAFKRALSITTRAIAGDRELDVRFGGEIAGLSGGRMVLPNPGSEPSPEAAAAVRGRADALALRLAHHDEAAHVRVLPPGATARAIFHAAEQARVEGLGARDMRGMAGNLEAALAMRCKQKGWQRVEDRQSAPMEEALALLVRERITGQPSPREADGLMNLWRDQMESVAGLSLDALAENADDQTAFADLLRTVIQDLDLSDELGGDPDQSENPEDEDEGVDREERTGDDAEGDDQQGDQPDTPDAAGTAGDEDEINADTDDAETRVDAMDDEGAAQTAMRPNWQPANDPDAKFYKVFTREFDEIIQASDLCEPDELERLRKYLDNTLKGLDQVVGRLANRLQRRLMAQQERAWNFDLEEGVLDGSRLARVIADPTLPLSYKQESDTEFRDTIVTLVLDNSGSMRGRPIMVAAACADILARTLERCGVKTEILGFTTKAWKGGRSKEKWLAEGKPPHPGRLNDLRHIIYKAADTPWRRARVNLGLMMREGLLKENIDGEALMWAWKRMAARPEQRRIMMVISDGAPVDDGTQSANSAGYLERHLRETIAMIETRSEVELLAIGIGHDVTRWYRRAVTINDVEQLGGAMTDQLAALFEEDGGKGTGFSSGKQGMSRTDFSSIAGRV
ncbi:cobaltochelatase subunit CobT [uncultured Maricaulis sp.]|uniref:cobaltochelatase subunit CobT n=1 Tax=uncultured Maricaulis sp. TaxID=174710 RepID=UPI00260814F3|nr:cobaltochelatase subunit CobT [uncultured Maricaulis sp.]